MYFSLQFLGYFNTVDNSEAELMTERLKNSCCVEFFFFFFSIMGVLVWDDITPTSCTYMMMWNLSPTHWPLGDFYEILNNFRADFSDLDWGISCEISFRWMPCTLLITSQHWFRQWFCAIRQQAFTWTNVDPGLCCHMVSLGHNDCHKIWCKYMYQP